MAFIIMRRASSDTWTANGIAACEFDTEQEADEEAERLATSHPGEEYRIFHGGASFKEERVVRRTNPPVVATMKRAAK